MSDHVGATPAAWSLGEALARFRGTDAYDMLMRVPVILYLSAGAVLQGRHVAAGIAALQEPPTLDFVLNALANGMGILFAVFLVVVFGIRMRPRARSSGPLPRLVAFVGAFSLTTLLFFPKVELPPVAAAASLLLMALGHGLACYALAHLGRSMSIMPEARRLVTSGPYAVVRNPLYAAEALASLGFLLQCLSWATLALWLAHIFLQLRRIHYEEEVLREAFPEYAEYARRVARLVPGVL